MESIRNLRTVVRTLGMAAIMAGALGCSGKVTGTKTPGTGSTTPDSTGGTPSTTGTTGTTGANAAPGVTGGATAGGVVTGGGTSATTSNTTPTAPTTGLGAAPPAKPPANLGTVVLRRLNSAEYNNTVRDLLGTTLTPASSFPDDDLGAEFTTVGSSLSLSPNYVREYENAAFSLMDDLFAAPAARQKSVITCSVDTGGDACARTIVTAFARNAFRRPATTAEIDALMAPVASAKTLGATPTDGLKSALAAVLMAPAFIFKVESDPAGTTGPHRLNAYELATRLSYALWGSMPDSVLSAAADANQLTADDQLKTQVDRMLADPRSSNIMDEFAGAWLDFKTVETHEVDVTVFKSYTPALLHSMRLEARNFIQDFLTSTQPVTSMLTANFTYVDATLAKLYGLSATPTKMGADGTWRADTTSSQRQGLLTLGSILTTTSLPTRTSPVRRGDFIFSRLLCGYIPPPPDNVATSLPEDATMTLRQVLAAHRANPSCAGCHNIMDPLGLGLENYDGFGAYRTMDGTSPVDATGTLADGRTFNGAKDLGTALATDPRFTPCMTAKFMTYSIGRLMNQPDDADWANYLAAQAKAANGSLSSLIRSVVSSEAFRSRQAM